ncbi:hypothetical protein BMS3Abin16_01137 [archaeon BMS3Abin16]|nr:hypothetical protein BMS3Abin16_01137 [archaeon BMS3Abin16]GBE57074.1 hypothetical protein BMS3Bbin16_01289 [archaeon BMS3Bbin16]
MAVRTFLMIAAIHIIGAASVSAGADANVEGRTT